MSLVTELLIDGISSQKKCIKCSTVNTFKSTFRLSWNRRVTGFALKNPPKWGIGGFWG